MNTALQQQRLEVEQLRREAAMKRIPVSQAVEDIKVIFSYKTLYILQLYELINIFYSKLYMHMILEIPS